MDDRPNESTKGFDYVKNGYLFSDKIAHLHRREEFRKYLDRTNVLNRLTTVLMDLYENPVIDFPVVSYVRKSLMDPNPDEVEMEKLRPKLEDAKSFCEFLENENLGLKKLIEKKVSKVSMHVANNENDDIHAES